MEREAESPFSSEQAVVEDLSDESAIWQKEKRENTILNRRLLQPRSNLEQNRLLLPWWNAELVNPISLCKYQPPNSTDIEMGEKRA